MANLSETPCEEQWEIVQATWPDGIPLTEETLVRANELGLDLYWLGEYLTGQARAEYLKIQGPALTEYKKIIGQAYAEYLKISSQALAEYLKLRDQALLQALKSLVE
jgi:hypothetical protein